MELASSAKRLMIVITVLLLAAAVAIIFKFQQPVKKAPFGPMLGSALPMLNLSVVMLDKDDHSLPPGVTLLGGYDKSDIENDRCPTLTGGDTSSPTVIKSNDKQPPECPKFAYWYVKKRPIALSIYFNDGQKVLEWWDSEPELKLMRDSRFMQGLLSGLLNSMKIKAEQLRLHGLQGEFLSQLLRDAVKSNAVLHYDMAHGRQGWVFSYLRGGRFAELALPFLVGLANSGYRLQELSEPIVELRLGLEHFFVTEYQQRIYLAQSLEALLNVIENLKAYQLHADSPLTLAVRGEAFVDHLLPVLTGSDTAPVEFGFDLQKGRLGALYLPAGPWQLPLHQHLFEGVLAGIPADAFAAVAGSYQLPATLTVADWQQFANKGPIAPTNGSEPAGLSLVWDFDGFSPRGAVGIAIANPNQAQASPAYRQYLRNPELGAECAGGSVFLAASSRGLLTRMQEACERQSLSPLDWQRGSDKQRLLSAQLFSFVNPGTALRELFLAGGAGETKEENEFAARWQQRYQQAKAAMREDGERLFSSLPIFSYAGRAENQAIVTLIGKTVNPETAP